MFFPNVKSLILLFFNFSTRHTPTVDCVEQNPWDYWYFRADAPTFDPLKMWSSLLDGH